LKDDYSLKYRFENPMLYLGDECSSKRVWIK